MKQGTVLKSLGNFTITPTKGRKFTIKQGCQMVVTSPSYKNQDGCFLDKQSKALIGSGYYFTLDQINSMFEIVK